MFQKNNQNLILSLLKPFTHFKDIKSQRFIVGLDLRRNLFEESCYCVVSLTFPHAPPGTNGTPKPREQDFQEATPRHGFMFHAVMGNTEPVSI